MTASDSMLRIGIAGLGGAAAQILPCCDEVRGVALAAAADVRGDARERFERAYDRPAYATVEELCEASDVDAVWVATPNPLHATHAVAAAKAGKHVVVEKPLGLSIDECDRVIAACERAGVQLLLGHSKTFDSPIRAIRDLVAGGRLGRVFQLDTWNFNDWLQRPRLAAEVDSAKGGGVVFRQAPQQIEIARYLIGTNAKSVRAVAGRRNPDFETEGHYSALIAFEDDRAASLSFNGYGHFDIAELTRGEAPGSRVRGPRRSGPVGPAEKYGQSPSGRPAARAGMPFCGLTLVSCEHGVVRQSPEGLHVYTGDGYESIPVPGDRGQAAVLCELRDAVRDGRPVFPDGPWGRATVEICLAILESSNTGREVPLRFQVPAPQPSSRREPK